MYAQWGQMIRPANTAVRGHRFPLTPGRAARLRAVSRLDTGCANIESYLPLHVILGVCERDAGVQWAIREGRRGVVGLDEAVGGGPGDFGGLRQNRAKRGGSGSGSWLESAEVDEGGMR